MLQQLGHILDLPAAENAIVEQVVLVLVNDFDGLPVDDDRVMAPFLAVESITAHGFAWREKEVLVARCSLNHTRPRGPTDLKAPTLNLPISPPKVSDL